MIVQVIHAIKSMLLYYSSPLEDARLCASFMRVIFIIYKCSIILLIMTTLLLIIIQSMPIIYTMILRLRRIILLKLNL